MNFLEGIQDQAEKGFHLCVGLDPDLKKIPEPLSVREFLWGIIDATRDLVACYKPNIAFFEDRGPKGATEYELVVEYINTGQYDSQDPIPVIGDMKRGDIGNTNRGYASAAFDLYEVDALTFNPYFGDGAYRPFFENPDKAMIALCRTSNPEADEFQKVPLDPSVEGLEDLPLPHYYYQYVAHRVANCWEHRSQAGLVVGATYPEDAEIVRKIAPETFLLLPGIGKQKGELAASVRAVRKGPFVLNASSAVLYALNDRNRFQDAAREVVKSYNEQIQQALSS